MINIKVANADGSATTKGLLQGLQWINDNRNNSGYNIKIVNISMNSSVYEDYSTSAIDAAVEVLWFNKITVVVSAGNVGSNGLYPPANDPFAITVGAVDDKGTVSTSDDTVASFSSYGTTAGMTKPDLVAPGVNIVSLLPSLNSTVAVQHPDHKVSNQYFRMSGTSMSAPVVSGAIALLLQSNPNLTPDQLKYRLKATAHRFGNAAQTGAGYLDAYAAIKATTSRSANTGLAVSKLFNLSGSAAYWNSVNWTSVNWTSVNWTSQEWISDYWGN